MKKLEPGTIVRIFKDTPTFPHGAIAMVIDNSTGEGEVEYMVKEIRGFAADPDSDQLPKPDIQPGKWVKRKNLEIINLKKPTRDNLVLLLHLLALTVGLAIGRFL